jgi:uncharacterized protein YbcI
VLGTVRSCAADGLGNHPASHHSELLKLRLAVSKYSYPGADLNGRLGAAISDAMVGLVRDAVGRGPTRARTFIYDDVIVCLLHETMTPLERTLHQEQRDDAVQEIRDVLHTAIGPPAQQRIEALTGRPVLATLADHHSDPDACVFVFLLKQPLGDELDVIRRCR